MMSRPIFSIFLILLSFHSLGNEQVPGIVVYPNETISVTFDVPTVIFTKEWDFTRLQSVAYFHDASGKKRRVSPKQALEIQLFLGDTDTIRMVSILHKGRGSRTFARIIKDGKLNVYFMMASPNAQGSSGFTFGTAGVQLHGTGIYHGFLVLKKGNWGPDVKARRLMLRKEMIEFFSDCPQVVEQIEDQKLTNNELSVVIDFYYQYCGND